MTLSTMTAENLYTYKLKGIRLSCFEPAWPGRQVLLLLADLFSLICLTHSTDHEIVEADSLRLS